MDTILFLKYETSKMKNELVLDIRSPLIQSKRLHSIAKAPITLLKRKGWVGFNRKVSSNLKHSNDRSD